MALFLRNKCSHAMLVACTEEVCRRGGRTLLHLGRDALLRGDTCVQPTKMDKLPELFLRACDSLFWLLVAVFAMFPGTRYLMEIMFGIIDVIKCRHRCDDFDA